MEHRLISVRLKRHRRIVGGAFVALAVVLGICCSEDQQRTQGLATVTLAAAGTGTGEVSDGQFKTTEFIKNNSNVVAFATIVICFAVATCENAQPPPPKVDVEKRADYLVVLIISSFLSLLSGMVNAVCFLEMGFTVAHMTGNTTHWGRLTGTDDAVKFLYLLVSFLVGAMVAGFNKVDGEALFQGRGSPGLLAASLAVAGGTAIRFSGGPVLPVIGLWSFSQGMQNAITRKCSSLPLCTTHMTGYLTDFGTGIGAYSEAVRCQKPVPSLKKPLLFGMSIVTFTAGGLIAKICRDVWGIEAALLPAGLMAAMATGLIPTGAVSKP